MTELENYKLKDLIIELEMRGHYLMQTAEDLQYFRKLKKRGVIGKDFDNCFEDIFDEIKSIDYTESTTEKELKKEVVENIEFQIQELQKINEEILKRKF